MPAGVWHKFQIQDFVTYDDVKASDNIVFVTATTRNHFDQSMALIASIQHWFPGWKILLYNVDTLELDTHQLDRVRLLHKIKIIYKCLVQAKLHGL